MKRIMPSLAALEAFDAVARLGHVTRAAEDLGRTQSAVSRQIANLEAFVRRPLFERARKRLVLNPAGRAYAAGLSRLLDQLEQETARLMTFGADKGQLRLGVPPTFASRWLIPRLAGYSPAGSGVDLVLVPRQGPAALDGRDVDAAIQYGDGAWPDVVSHQLVAEDLVAVVAPGLWATGALDRPLGRLRMTIRADAWDLWDAARAATTPRGPVVLNVENFTMMIEAACQGLGVGVMPTIYADDELARGRLIAPFGAPVASGRGYWLNVPATSPAGSAVWSLATWLGGGATRAGAGA